MLTLSLLNDCPAIRHGFFTREGGVSEGLFASLNCGPGSGDNANAVAENRRRALQRLGLAAGALCTLHQCHSANVVLAESPWSIDARPRADAVVTRAKGLALGILTADCAPVLLADPSAGVLGAAHAGWKGALTGVIEAVVEAMTSLGAEPKRILAGVGPAIAQRSYEVGPEFPTLFLEQDDNNAVFFQPGDRAGHSRFDLKGYVCSRLRKTGVGQIAVLPCDTYAESRLFFSYRRACHQGEEDYGRLLSVIGLEP